MKRQVNSFVMPMAHSIGPEAGEASIPEGQNGQGRRAGRLKILSLSIEYPNPVRPGFGLFVRSRLQHLGQVADVKVVAPVALLDYSDPHRKWLRPGSIPVWRLDDHVEVVHPRWVYPPGGTPMNVACLYWAMLPHLKRLKTEFDFQILDAHFGYPDGVAAALAARALNVPFLVTLRGNEPMFAESALRHRCLRWSLSRAARVIAVSEELKQFALRMGVAPKKARTIGNGVDAAIFYLRDRAAIRAQHGIPPDAKMILCAGALIEAKGHHHVIRALRQLQAEGSDLQLFIAGGATSGGPKFDHVLRNLAAELGLGSRVRLLGWVAPPRLAEFLSAADVFCLASDSEGWPNVIHEALACGAPVVSTRVGAVAEMIPSEQFGFTVEVGDQPALVTALRRALEKPWDRQSIAAWGQARSWKRVAEEVLQEMRGILQCAE